MRAMVPMSDNVGKQSGTLFIAGEESAGRSAGSVVHRKARAKLPPLSVTRRLGPPTLRVLLATLMAVATLAFGTRANAAVPMCSEDGRSIAAPPIMRPKSGLVLESRGDCERLRALLSSSNPGDHQRGGAIEAGDAPL